MYLLSVKNVIMVVCIRYYNERCINVVEAKKLDAYSLTDLIQTTLSSLGLDPHKAVIQSYDGVAGMSGVKSGVQTRMREKYDKAVYVHCWAHKLNLVLVRVCSCITHVLNFFSTLQFLDTFFPDLLFGTLSTLTNKTLSRALYPARRWCCPATFH